jgi:hypothetical protein
MNLPLLIGSVVGVLVLAWAAWLLGLGGASIADEAEAQRRAVESDLTFEPDLAFVSTDRRSALVHARDDSWMVLKVHGAQVATRRLQSLELRPEDNGVTVATSERMFADVHLELPREARDKLLTMV